MAAAALLGLAGCVGTASPLPPDTTSVYRAWSLTLADFTPTDAALSCADIEAQRQALAATMRDANGRIEANRGRDQAAVHFAVVLAAPFIADSNDPERRQIQELYSRQDTLIQLAAVKGCSAAK